MAVAYFDTSALVKLVVDEPGTPIAQRAWNDADVVVSGLLTYPEGRAALAAAQRRRRLTAQRHRAALDRFEEAWSALEVIEIAPMLARAAGDLADRLALRGYDGVHLATAFRAAGFGGVLVTWDRELSRAALTVGLAVVPSTRRPR
jgi:predicted nucleic acid-binding protein